MKVLQIKQIPEHLTSSESSKEGGEEDIIDKKGGKEVSQKQTKQAITMMRGKSPPLKKIFKN